MTTIENIQSPTNSFILLLLSFANLAWFCSTNVPKTNTKIVTGGPSFVVSNPSQLTVRESKLRIVVPRGLTYER